MCPAHRVANQAVVDSPARRSQQLVSWSWPGLRRGQVCLSCDGQISCSGSQKHDVEDVPAQEPVEARPAATAQYPDLRLVGQPCLFQAFERHGVGDGLHVVFLAGIAAVVEDLVQGH